MRLWPSAVVAGVRVKQAFTFMSPEWDEFHEHARQSIESLHSGFKDDGKEVVASSGRRRVRGFAAGQILVTIMLINFNPRTIAKFLRDEVEAESEPDRARADPSVRRRDRVWDNAYTKTTARDSRSRHRRPRRTRITASNLSRPRIPTPPKGTHRRRPKKSPRPQQGAFGS